MEILFRENNKQMIEYLNLIRKRSKSEINILRTQPGRKFENLE